MKKISYGLLISLLFIVNVGMVYASDLCDSDTTITGSKSSSKTQLISITTTEHTYDWYERKYTMSDGTYAYGAFCRNGGLNSSETNADSFTMSKCVNLTTTSSNSALNSGVMAILNEYNEDNYWSVLIALRMYDYYFSEVNRLNTSGLSDLYNSGSYGYVAWNLAYAYLAENLASSDSEIRGYLSDLSGINTPYTSKSFIYPKVSISSVDFLSSTSSYYTQAVALLKEGLKKAAEVAKKETNDEEISVTVKTYDPERSVSDSKYTATLTFNISYSGYSGLDEEDQILKLEFEDNKKSAVTRTIYINDNKITTSSGKIEINMSDYSSYVDLSTDGSFDLKIVYELSSTYCSSDIEYTLDVSYPGEDSDYDFELYEMTACSNICQYFYVVQDLGNTVILDDEDNLVTDPYEGSFSPCDFSCEDLQSLCAAANYSASNTYCQQFKEEYGSNCVECTTYVSNASCSDSTVELEIIEGVEGDADSCEIPSSTAMNVLQCVIGQSDLIGNSYETDYVSSSYCSVYCAEEYYIELPGIQAVNSGRYFTLSASIKGTKHCYTSEIDSDDTFEDDEEAAREAIYEAYNNWSMYNTLSNLTATNIPVNNSDTVQGVYNHMIAYQTSYDSTTYFLFTLYGELYNVVGVSYNLGESIWNYGTYSYWQKAACYYNYTYYSDCYYNSNGIQKNFNYDIFYGRISYTTYNNQIDYSDYLRFGSASVDCDGYTCTVYPVSPYEDYVQNYQSTYATLRDQWASQLETAINDYQTLINEYNSCSGSSVKLYTNISSSLNNQSSGQEGWKMSYNFEPEVSFWYQETSYINSAYTTIMEAYGTSSNGSVSQTYYTCDVNDEYTECETGSGSRTSLSISDGDYDTLTNYLCYSTGSGEYTCDKSKTVYVSTAKYVKQETTSKASYITPTQFYTIYSSGAIAVTVDGTVNSENVDNSSVIENGLPVGLGTVSGVYNYVLQVTNLGEYSDGSLGRIWGGKNNNPTSVVTAAIEKYEVCYTDFALADAGSASSLSSEINSTILDLNKGVYVCAYKVSCPNCPVECDPVCEWDCTGSGCDVDCVDCVYTNKINYSYRTITSSDTNPNNRELGSNWNIGTDITTALNSITTINSELQLKAYVTTIEIFEDGESIYDIDNGENVSDVNNDYVLTVTMNSSMVSWIQKYNTAAGDYLTSSDGESSTLKCYDYKDGETYDNIFCYSTFLDDLIAAFPSNVSGVSNRPTADQRTTITANDIQDNENSYWTTWNTSNWSVTTRYSLDASVGLNDYTSGVGPSWK